MSGLAVSVQVLGRTYWEEMGVGLTYIGRDLAEIFDVLPALPYHSSCDLENGEVVRNGISETSKSLKDEVLPC